jgi:hopanoid biosynthesis associated glycosyl transferase protein HpnI
MRDLELIIDATLHGANRKVSNLINMTPPIRHDIVILADSDIRVAPDYLARVIAALQQPGVGAVTCLYHGVAVSGPWSRLGALFINAHFLPSVVLGLASGLAQPCFGSTIALKRSTLDAIGGFAAFADRLDDDYAIGAAVRERGNVVAIPPFTVAHLCNEASLTELWRHELRWARTIRNIAPLGHAGGRSCMAPHEGLDSLPSPTGWCHCGISSHSRYSWQASSAAALVGKAITTVCFRAKSQVCRSDNTPDLSTKSALKCFASGSPAMLAGSYVGT